MFKVAQQQCKRLIISKLPHSLEVKVGNFNQPFFTRRSYHVFQNKSQNYLYSFNGVRLMSDKPPVEIHLDNTILSTSPSTRPSFEHIPEPPSLPSTPITETFDISPQVVDTIQTVGSFASEPTLASMGLGGYSPVGLIQRLLEYLHVAGDIPWWGTIVIGTICVRILIFPLVIITQRNSAHMNNHLPQMQALQLKMTQARQTGNQLDSARYGQEMMLFMKEKQMNPFKNMLVPLAQAPLFISFFMGLRGMANCPVESLSTGGLFWFTDLIVPDQYYLLPVITSCTLWATIELGTDGGRLNAQNMHMLKYFLRAIPVVMLPFTINFPGAILCYWVSSNFISLIQVGFLRIPAVRDYFKIPRIVKHNPENLPIANKGFVQGAKESWSNMKISREVEDRQRVDEFMFNKAGKGAILKTYKYDPTKVISAKKSTS